ncbi:Redoxin [Pedobacter westerhofensis]|uniref:Redoxin n=1 Tax=Pedobacter westerhofensis TaxID=425512 RepID=A0A521C877_9SPHI|nr:TlpA disulfide reductase family protein [Pedobacter westerhofensis]SMO55608.1 Redoxin [Pedobacter westerhofensis]
MTYKMLTFFLLIFAFSNSAYAEGDAYLTVHVTNREMAKKPLLLFTVQDHIDFKIGAVEQRASADVNGDFKFHILGISKYRTLIMEVGEYLFLSNYIEEGDDIHIVFSGDGSSFPKPDEFIFSGQGSGKLIARTKIMAGEVRTYRNISAHRKYDKLILDSLVSAANTAWQADLELLKPFKKEISALMYQQLQADIYARAAAFSLGYISGQRKQYTTAENLDYLYAKLDQGKPKILAAVQSQSAEYMSYLLFRALEMVALKNVSKQDRPLAICKELILQNKGLVLEKTLMRYLCRYPTVTNSRNPEEVYSLALEYIRSPANRKYLIALSESRKAGAMAYNFSLPDTSGHIFRLSDFKNKVVVIDCWFTGCSSCSGMAKRVEKEVLPSFIHNPDVVFVSVCADKDRSMWLKSVKGGFYTNPGSINLFTEGMGTSHPFLKKYNLQGFPRFILVGRDGRMFASEMPRGMKDMIEMISQALNVND